MVANLDANFDLNRGEACIYLAADISAEQLQEYFMDNIQCEESVEWNESAQRVEVKQSSRIGKIVLQESIVHNSESREAVQECLIQAIRDIGLECLNWSAKAERLKQRVQFIHHNLDNNPALKKQFADQPLPDF